VRSGSATRRWKDLDKGHKIASDLILIGVGARSYGLPKSRDSNRDTFGTISGLHFGSPEKKSHSDVVPAGERKVYYREYGGGISRV
jgi:hypothetical protein